MRGVYIASDSSLMTESDLLDWLKYKIKNGSYADELDFDDITGGIDEFIENNDYYKIKNKFEELKQNLNSIWT